MSRREPWIEALVSGLAGAVALTVLHETARRVIPDAPRMDVLGRRGLTRGLRALGLAVPSEDAQQGAALVGDIASNGLSYALVGLGSPETATLHGGVIGAVLGVGALVLPPVLELGPEPTRLKPRTQVMTFAWYFAGGLVAGEVYRRLRSSQS